MCFILTQIIIGATQLAAQTDTHCHTTAAHSNTDGTHYIHAILSPITDIFLYNCSFFLGSLLLVNWVWWYLSMAVCICPINLKSKLSGNSDLFPPVIVNKRGKQRKWHKQKIAGDRFPTISDEKKQQLSVLKQCTGSKIVYYSKIEKQ